MFMLTEGGRVKFWSQGGKKGMILAETHAMAKKVADWFRKKKNANLTVAEIGTVEGETLKGQFEASLKEGANCAFVVRAVEEDRFICDVMEPS